MSNIFSQMNLGDILDDTFHIYKSNFWRLLAITAIGLIGLLILAVVASINGFHLALHISWSSLGGWSVSTIAEWFGGLTGSMAVLLIILGVASIVGGILMVGALTHAVSQQWFRQEISIGRAYSFAWRRLGAMVGAAVLVGLPIGGLIAISRLAANLPRVGWILVVVCACASIYLIIRWIFALPAALLEGLGPVAALSRSHRLVKNNWWRVLGITLVVALISGLAAFILGGVAQLLQVVGVGLIVAIILLPSIYGTANTLLYYGSRARKEEYGTETLASELHIDFAWHNERENSGAE
jgi:hypothetical protein